MLATLPVHKNLYCRSLLKGHFSKRPPYQIYSLDSRCPSAHHNPLSCFIYQSTYHHLFQYWQDIYFIYLCVYCLSLSFTMAEVFCFIQWCSPSSWTGTSTPLSRWQKSLAVFKGTPLMGNYKLFLEHTWSRPINDLHFPLLINKLLLVGSWTSFWLLTLHSYSKSIIVSCFFACLLRTCWSQHIQIHKFRPQGLVYESQWFYGGVNINNNNANRNFRWKKRTLIEHQAPNKDTILLNLYNKSVCFQYTSIKSNDWIVSFPKQ